MRLAFESKRLPKKMLDDAGHASLANIALRPPDSVIRRKIAAADADHAASYLRKLEPLLDQGSDAAESKARALMLAQFGIALSRGYALAGKAGRPITSKEAIDLARFTEAEVGYFMRFHASLREEAMGKDHRLGLYSGAITASMWRGWLATLPSDAKIEWKLGIAEHCGGCLSLAAGSPYDLPGLGSNPLPTVPREGATPCLGNCYCYLVGRSPTMSSDLLGPIGIEVLAIGALTLDPTSDAGVAAGQLYQRMEWDRAWQIRMQVVRPDAGHRQSAEDIESQIEAQALLLRHQIRHILTDAELREAPQDALAIGYTFVDPKDVVDDDEDLINALALIIDSERNIRGKIERVRKGAVRIDGQWIEIGEGARSLLFVLPRA